MVLQNFSAKGQGIRGIWASEMASEKSHSVKRRGGQHGTVYMALDKVSVGSEFQSWLCHCPSCLSLGRMSLIFLIDKLRVRFDGH